jgi:hypothetical protein
MKLLLVVAALLAAGCSTTSYPLGPASDAKYGYTAEKPIKVGGQRDGPAREQAFLAELRGPSGELVRFQRQGSCCSFKTENGIMGIGMLDKYAVWIGTEPVPKILYLNMYDYDEPRIPIGFTKKGN